MANHARWAWLLAMSVGAASITLAHCSSDEGPPPSSGVKKASQPVCRSPKTMAVTELSATTQPGVLRGKAKGADGKEWVLQIELNERSDYKQQAGDYDLSEQATDYDNCKQCVVAYQGDQLVGATKQLFQTSGTMKLATVSSPVSSISKGLLEGVELREVKIDAESAEVSEVSGGTCYKLSAYEWDTTPPAGQGCQTAEDCGDPSSVACDPKTGTCVAFACEVETNKGCVDGQELCLSQEIGAAFGACHPTCIPFVAEAACPSGMECEALDSDQTSGKCVKTGSAGEGAPCTLNALSTGCQAGLTCVPADDEGGAVCRRTCNFFDEATTTSCGSGQRCTYGGVCSAEPGDTVALGATCSAGLEGTTCGLEGGTYRGACVNEGGTLMCRRLCRTGSVYRDCDEGMVCVENEGELALPTCQAPSIEEETP